MKKILNPKERTELMHTLQARFEKNMNRHKGLQWAQVQAKLDTDTNGEAKLWSINKMEITGGEPDVVLLKTIVNDKNTDAFIFIDCSAESPKGRRSLCYDHEALEARKEHKPENSAVQMASDMGIDLLTEEQYRELQELEKFDRKTSSWVHTPAAIRKHGGAVFCDRRYEHVFLYHNGAESYYAARGFRGWLMV